MKIYEVRNNKVTALSALKRRSSAPQLVVVAPSGSGKSTLIYLLLNHRLIPFMKIGIGEKSQTTIIPCEFCFDERIQDDYKEGFRSKGYSHVNHYSSYGFVWKK